MKKFLKLTLAVVLVFSASTAFAQKFGRAFIDGADDVDKLNLALDQIGGIEHALTSKKELGALLNAKAKELGCKFSKEEGTYVPNNA